MYRYEKILLFLIVIISYPKLFVNGFLEKFFSAAVIGSQLNYPDLKFIKQLFSPLKQK